MKKKFTFLIAALALLTFLAVPMGMRGQSRTTQTVSYGWETTDDADPWTISDEIEATQGEGNTGSYAGKINTASTTVQFNEKVYVTSFSYAFKRTSKNSNYSVYIETSTDGSTWTIKDTQTMSTFDQNGAYRTVTKEFDGTQEVYVRFRCNNTTAVRYVDDVTITYATSAAQLDPCDLALTNVSTSIVFDLYNNSDPRVINYTTSSTGEVTVSENDYINAVVDQVNKTITITPVAVTNGAKVITVNQAADDNYAAGSKTFTINITDSTPFSGGNVTFNAVVDKDLENTTQGEGSITKFGIVTFACDDGILGNGSEYRMYKNSTTTFSVSEGTITQIVFTGTSGNPASGFATQTGWTTNGNNGTWTGAAQQVYFTASGAQVRATQIVVTVTLPSTDPSISAENVNIAYNATSGSIAYTLDAAGTSGTVTASVPSGSWLTLDEVANNEVPFTCAANDGAQRTETVTITYTYPTNQTVSTEVTVTQAAYSNEYNGQGTFTKVTTLADLEDGGYYVLTYDNHALKAAYYGNSSNEMASESVTITNDQINNPATNIVWKLEANSTNWNLYNESAGKYCNITSNSTTGFNLGDNATSYTVSASDPAATYTFATTATGGRCISYYSNNTSFRSYASSNATTKLTLYKLGEAPTDPYFTAENVEIAHNANGGSITYTLNNPVGGGVVSVSKTSGDWLTLGQGTTSPISFTCSANTGNADREAVVRLTYTYGTSKATVTTDVTVTQKAPARTYTLATSITSGRHYVIAATTSNVTKAMGGKNATKDYYDAIDASIDGNTITVPANSEIQEFVIVGPNADGYYYIYDPVAGGYLYASSSSSNDLSYQTQNNANGLWEIDFTESTVTAKGTNDHNLLRYNSSSPRFSCYTSGQTDIAFYEKNESDPQYDFYVDIAAWTTGDPVGGWNFIASPISGNINPSATGMLTADNGSDHTYDLYQLENTLWENYRTNEGNAHPGFNLVNGQGYLYANSANVTLHFSGAINEFTITNNANVKSLSEGWNLIGNPYSIPVYINKPYYTLNETGDAIVATEIKNVAIYPCTGVIVNGGANDNVTFTEASQNITAGHNGNIQMTLAQTVATRSGSNTATIDNAIVSFNEGSQLEKFYFGTQNANIYIPQGNEEYAIVNAQARGEMPVNFKAHENGEYTLTVNTENVEMGYLHLVDNMTGADIDLLNTPSYTFNARTDDYTSRFKLVFSANGMNNENGNDDFAFLSNGQLIIANDGEATLQVIDITGRVLSSEVINGSCTKNIDAATGVYVIRLTNGSNVKTQKVIIK